jgi:4-phytase/acid phosphatase
MACAARAKLRTIFGTLLIGLAAAALAAGRAARPGDPPGLVLERVVIVERHGVRSPTKPPEALNPYSAEAWPGWPVAPGELTPHGAADVRLMGAWLRSHYAERGLWPAAGCPAPGAAFVWADGHDHRTRESGDAVLAGAFPGCGLSAVHGPVGADDPVFDGGKACPVDPEAALAALKAALPDPDHPGEGYEAGKAALWSVLDPAGPAACVAQGGDKGGACYLAGAGGLGLKNGQARLEGPLPVSATLAENLYLEYAQGMPESQVGWGRAGGGRLEAIMRLHAMDADLTRQTPYIAAHGAAVLGGAVSDALEGRGSLPGQPSQDPGKLVRLTVFLGHDTNLSNLAGVLGVRWTLTDQPDVTPPDGALVFELWRDPAGGGRYVRTVFLYQTLAQLRAETPLDAAHPPGRETLTLPACHDGPDGACPLAHFRRLMADAVPAACRKPQ